MNLIGFDIETWGLHPGYALQPWQMANNESGIISLALATKDSPTVSTCFPSQQELIKMLSKKNPLTVFVGWNIKFDLAFLIAKGLKDVLRDTFFIDGMLLLKRMGYDLPTYALKPSLKKFAEHIDYTPDYNKDIEFKTGAPMEVYTPEELTAMLRYNGQDALYTVRLVDYLISLASKSIIQQCVRESTIAFEFADAWQRGILIDEEALNTCELEMDNRINRLGSLLPSVQLTSAIIKSPKQLQQYIKEYLKLPLSERTASGAFSVNQKVIKNLYYKTTGTSQQILRLILQYKEAVTEHDKFIVSAKECCKSSNLAHPSPMLNSTYTGRLTYSATDTIQVPKVYKNGKTTQVSKKIRTGVPMHQIKKRGKIRSIFCAPKGYSLLELDFSAQEMRLIACIAKESTMIKLFNENKDMHAYTAAGILQMPYEEFLKLATSDPKKYKEARFLGKLTNLALQYRLSAKGLYRQWHDVYGLTDKSIDDATIAKNAYLDIYQGIPTYWQYNTSLALQNGYIENAAGRKCYITKWDIESNYKSEQTAINFPIQSTGAEQKILGLYKLQPFLHANHIQLGWDLHDGLYFYIPESVMQHELILEMVNILSNLPYKEAWGWEPQVKFPVEAKLGTNWANLKLVN